mgnify:CR=1 FL=1
MDTNSGQFRHDLETRANNTKKFAFNDTARRPQSDTSEILTAILVLTELVMEQGKEKHKAGAVRFVIGERGPDGKVKSFDVVPL